MAEVDVTDETLERLSGKLSEFSATLPEEEQVTLQAMLSLAGQQLEVNPGEDEVEGFAFRTSSFTQFGSRSSFQQSFARSFGSFTGYSAPAKTGAMAPSTICYEG